MTEQMPGNVGWSGYAAAEGTVLQGAELSSLLQGLAANELLGGYTHMLTVRKCARKTSDCTASDGGNGTRTLAYGCFTRVATLCASVLLYHTRRCSCGVNL